MIGSILGSILGNQPKKEDGQEKGLGSLLGIGIILFALLGGFKLFQKQEDDNTENGQEGIGT